MPNQTGPTSDTAHLHSCMNNFRHGGTSERLFVRGEDPQAFFALLENASLNTKPAFDQDAILVTRSVRSNWILMRRERAAKPVSPLSGTKNPPTPLGPNSPGRTPHRRSLRPLPDRCPPRFHPLPDLQLIQKMSRDEQRWQIHFESQKRKIVEDPAVADFLESLEKLKKDVILEEEEDEQTMKPTDSESQKSGPHIPQAVYACYDAAGATIAYECSPKNPTVATQIATAPQHPTPPAHVVRTYHFKGPIPAQLEWLISVPAQRAVDYREINVSLTFGEWKNLSVSEA